MDHFKRLYRQVSQFTFLFTCLIGLLPIVGYYLIDVLTPLSSYLAFLAAMLMALVISLISSVVVSNYALKPLRFVWQAVLHVSSGPNSPPAPNLDELKTGHELVSSLAMQIYQFASQQDSSELIEHRRQLSQAANVMSHLPLPLFVFNKAQQLTNASDEALRYCQLESSDLFGRPLYEFLNLEFPDEHTLDAWIQACQVNKITDITYWEHVRVRLPGEAGEVKQCDMIASYNKDNPSGTEFIVMLFDRTDAYNQEDSSLSFLSLAVHELRTPLTMLRGYIEVFQSELATTLSPELQGFMHKMSVSADQLTAFVNNILNVARVEENQLVLKLNEARWDEVLKEALEALELRAKINNKTIECHIEPNLPTVAIDRISVQEVINNLVDNAIKYSGTDPGKIIVTAKLKDGMVETTVQDFGVGISQGVIANLFVRYYRNHRTKGDVGGTGLGLFLSKALVTAHGGQIWVSSKEGEGSTFGFSLVPYAQLADEQKNSNNKDITRHAHGWIKNHSLYRR